MNEQVHYIDVTYIHLYRIYLSKYILATPSGLWDLSSLPRTCTHASCSGREVLPFTNIHKETDVGKHILLYLVFLWIAEVSAVG